MLFGEGTGIGEEKVAEEEMDEFIWRRKGIARVGEGRKSKVRERLLFFHKIKLLKKIKWTFNVGLKPTLKRVIFLENKIIKI